MKEDIVRQARLIQFEEKTDLDGETFFDNQNAKLSGVISN